ncbi:tetratricopeptide repeat protein [Bdellovibrio sp. HCB337]|uniref:tetratricopeptide repeat protein n=1 Tax=Bdellovibrio sp. HCB337 TaxID=3394358 RepID=UPI0039A67A55
MPISKTNLFKGLALFLLAALVFLPLGAAEFLLWDDQIHLSQNPFFSPFSWQSLLDIWTTPYPVGPSLYIPVTYSFWGLLAPFSQNFTVAWPFLLLNFAIHLVNAALVYRLLNRLVPSLEKNALLFGVLIFVFHPLQVESVVWMSGFKDMVWVTFALLTLLAYLRKNLALTYTGLILAILCKPIAVVIPLMILGLEFFMAPEKKTRQRLLYLGSLFAVALPFMFLTKILQPDVLVRNIPALWERPVVALDALGFYLKKVFLPVGFGPDYGRRPDLVLEHFPTYELVLPVLFVGILAWFSKVAPELKKTFWLAGLFLLVPLLPVLGFVPFQFQNFSTVADRYFYFSMVGIGLLAAVAYTKLPRAKWVLVALLPVFMGLSHFFSQYWRTNQELFTHALVINPDSKSAGNNLGIILSQKNQLKEALPYFQHVYEVYPDNFAAANNIGIIYLRLGEIDKAISHYVNNLKVFPTNTDARISYGELLMQMNKDEEALAQLRQATEQTPSNAYGWYMYSQILWKTGQREESLQHLKKAIEIEPFNEGFKKRLEDFNTLIQLNK